MSRFAEAPFGRQGICMPPHVKLELHLPGLVIGVDDVELTGLSRRAGRAKLPASPYLITGRASGLAVDATLRTSQGHPVEALPPHALPHQLW